MEKPLGGISRFREPYNYQNKSAIIVLINTTKHHKSKQGGLPANCVVNPWKCIYIFKASPEVSQSIMLSCPMHKVP